VLGQSRSVGRTTEIKMNCAVPTTFHVRHVVPGHSLVADYIKVRQECFDQCTRWRTWFKHCATSRKVAGLIPDGITKILH
jgi:hypothetical protein